MKINFTKKEFTALMDMVWIAEWILHAHVPGGADDEYSALEQKVYACAREFGLDDRIVFDEELKKHFPAADYEESERLMGAVDAYDDASFWMELVDRLVDRDLVERFGEQGYAALGDEERLRLRLKRSSEYEAEFHVHGLNALRLGFGPPRQGHN